MPLSNLPRNVFVYDYAVPQGEEPVLVAGFWQFGRTTGGEFYSNLEICFLQPPPSAFRLRTANGIVLPRDGAVVPTGVFYVVSLSRPAPKRFVLIVSGSRALRASRSYQRSRTTANNLRKQPWQWLSMDLCTCDYAKSVSGSDISTTRSAT